MCEICGGSTPLVHVEEKVHFSVDLLLRSSTGRAQLSPWPQVPLWMKITGGCRSFIARLLTRFSSQMFRYETPSLPHAGSELVHEHTPAALLRLTVADASTPPVTAHSIPSAHSRRAVPPHCSPSPDAHTGQQSQWSSASPAGQSAGTGAHTDTSHFSGQPMAKRLALRAPAAGGGRTSSAITQRTNRRLMAGPEEDAERNRYYEFTSSWMSRVQRRRARSRFIEAAGSPREGIGARV